MSQSKEEGLISKFKNGILNSIVSNRKIYLTVPSAVLSISGLLATILPQSSLTGVIRTSFFILTLVTSIILFYSIYIIKKYGEIGRIFSLFGSNVMVVTSGLVSNEDKAESTPPYEDTAAIIISKQLKKWGKNSDTVMYNDESLISWDIDIVLIGGPAKNELARKLNESLFDKVYGAFCFVNFGESPEVYISQAPFSYIKIPFLGLLADDASIDHGIIYIGPNPMNENRRIIWIAGLAPYATYGAAKLLSEELRATQIGDQLNDLRSFCSILFKYDFSTSITSTRGMRTDRRRVEDGTIKHIIISRGELGVPSASTVPTDSDMKPMTKTAKSALN